MSDETYYDILGVKNKASLEEITQAKNKLAKKYHPDANMRHGIDTTEKMQQILEAYKVLSDPDSRKEYDKSLLGLTSRSIMQTFDLQHPEKDSGSTSEDAPIVRCWKVAGRLQEIVEESNDLFKSHTKTHKLSKLSKQASKYVAYLKNAGIPERYWYPEIMSWLLFTWYKNRNYNLQHLLTLYDQHVKEDLKTIDQLKIKSIQFNYQRSVKHLIKY